MAQVPWTNITLADNLLSLVTPTNPSYSIDLTNKIGYCWLTIDQWIGCSIGWIE